MSTNEHWKEEERKAFDFQFHGINWIAPEYKSNVMEYFFARLAAREKEVREKIAKEIESKQKNEECLEYKEYKSHYECDCSEIDSSNNALQVAANIARGK
jgi:hypothetical protein